MNVVLIVLTICFLAAIVIAVLGLISPRLTKSASRGKAFLKGLIPAFLILAAIGVLAPEPPSNDTDIAYKVTKDHSKRNIKRAVDVLLPERIDKSTLKALAQKLYREGYKRTFIGYRLQEDPDGPYWATTNYNPDLEVNILGTSKRENNKLISKPLTADGKMLGKWVVNWGYKYKAVILESDDGIFIKTLFSDGSGNTEKLAKSTVGNTIRYYEGGGKERGEYYTISPNGDLQFWGQNGNYYTAPHTSEEATNQIVENDQGQPEVISSANKNIELVVSSLAENYGIDAKHSIGKRYCFNDNYCEAMAGPVKIQTMGYIAEALPSSQVSSAFYQNVCAAIFIALGGVNKDLAEKTVFKTFNFAAQNGQANTSIAGVNINIRPTSDSLLACKYVRP